ncbi:MAG: hypothetical protein PHF18_02565 [Methanosarcina sp.]|uniref:hypothetical protein n=1 Tax=Methanosarcina sp. TaxID=2213 RepID=UPI00263911B8|nr:hypothetical protein [Methanosarcina sp.]MDD3245742.1 hypothetical protein [Methanosarcina sp.]
MVLFPIPHSCKFWRRSAPEAVGTNLRKVLEKAGVELEFCNPEKTVYVGILLVE